MDRRSTSWYALALPMGSIPADHSLSMQSISPVRRRRFGIVESSTRIGACSEVGRERE